ncbi:MAG TPA: DUF6412 domain-containing protein [Pseudonocardiaceae bacterium]|nr:DUF6412 domain-containing protein [Pseudonocardiaceae bacterium]
MLTAVFQMIALHVQWTLSGVLPAPAGAALLGVAVTGLLLVVLLVGQEHGELTDSASARTRSHTVALREHSRHAAPLRLRNPDAPGRTRSRAPGHSAAA